ncbi:MAG: YihY/virulence factor BrkB family protein [Hyphomicrobiales bacterium]
MARTKRRTVKVREDLPPEILRRRARRRRWRGVLWRLWDRVLDDRADLIAAGAAFYLLLALFPALAAFVSLFGFVAPPAFITRGIEFLGTVLPAASVLLIESQLNSLIGQGRSALSFGVAAGFAVAFWFASRGIKALFAAMNVAFGVREGRSFLVYNLLSFAFTLGAMAVAGGFIIAVGVIPAVMAVVGLDAWTEQLVHTLRWPVLLVSAMAGITLLYRFGPSRTAPRLRWILVGAGLATVAWLGASIGLSWYLQNFANYNVTYGSLGAVAGFLTWAWVSVFILIAGAEVSAELEQQYLAAREEAPVSAKSRARAKKKAV